MDGGIAVTARHPLVAQVCGQLREAGAVAVVGPTGFGKSAVLEAVCTAWQAAGDPVVRLSSAPADAHVPYVPLVDLFTVCPAEVRGELSELQRSAIDWVLRRVTGPEPDPATLRVTVLSCLQAWGRKARLLLTADDVHWWGPGSLDVFGFAARRSRGSVSLLAALRPDGPPSHDVLGSGAVEITVPTLTPQESTAIVRSFGIPLRAAGRIHTAAGGNPRLVSDIAAGVARAGGAAVLDTQPLAPHARKALRAWLADLAAPVHWVLLVAALAADPSLDAVRRAAGPPADAALAAAEAAGLIHMADGAVDFPAPVVREGLVAEASGEAVRQAHLALAEAMAEPDDRTWHEASALALAEIREHLVPALAAAAAAARDRGDHARAAEFGLLAVDRAVGAQPELLVAAARDAEAAGRFDLACTVLDQLVRARTRAQPAVHARARLAVVDAAGRGAALLEHVAAQALAEATAAGEPTLVSAAHLRLARSMQMKRGCSAEALAHARNAVEWAERADDPASHAAAMALTAQIEQGRGSPNHAVKLRLALGSGTAAAVGRLNDDPRRVAVGSALLEDRLDEAGRLLDELRPAVGEADRPADLLWLLGSSIRIRAHSGEGQVACEEARRLMSMARDLGASPGPPWYAAATAELAGGTLEQALAYAELGLSASEEEADTVFAARCLHLSGMTRLLLRDTGGALADLLRVRDLVQDLAVADPGVIRYEADLAEVLVAAGDLEAATRTVAGARRRAEELGRRGVLASLDRAEALCHTAAGEFGAAEDLLVRALDTFERLGYPLECGRVLLAHSSAEQRRRRPARSRELRAAAEAVFHKAGAPLWEPGRPGRTRAPVGPAGLTDAEKRIAELVTEGHANRDIAAALYVSVKTVEAALTRIYRKLEVRSRVQLMALVHKDGHRPGR
ncbi:AAA family ATPase [Streptomyces sp. ISL-10]|uniref:helix-turn-helix transcriptional regulator n=1 Tax=Streptomyces sp. ISL-10 TaxID=2819172 RepID=UPI001BEA5E6C|nr:LuxR family transcriptional regulator [Streptomyces sp. ISL-10]MBT2364998.1 AAA family ATPase [Streptomyces sp. ISL-10]